MKLSKIDLNRDSSMPYKKAKIQLRCKETLSPALTWKLQDTNTLEELHQRELNFKLSSKDLCFSRKQITPCMRAILGDWMIEVADNFLLKRETLHLGISIVDQYLSLCSVTKPELQLVGLCCLFIAAKVEEVFAPRAHDFLQVAGNVYSFEEMVYTERLILVKCRWRISHATLINWTSWLMSEWDNFAQETGLTSEFLFKSPKEYSYKLFRQAVGIVDAVALDQERTEFPGWELAVGSLYLVLERETCSLQIAGAIKKHFDYWLKEVFGVQIEELSNVLSYLYGYLGLPIGYELPRACVVVPKEQLVMHYEDFLAYQSHSSKTLPFVKNRIRQASALHNCLNNSLN